MPNELKKPTVPVVEVRRLLALRKSNRKPRPVVTPMGNRARGNVPSLKTPVRIGERNRFESLVEDDFCRVLEVASSVVHYVTHPYVVDLSLGSGRHDYTPDAEVTMLKTLALAEAKGDYWLSVESARMTLAKNAQKLKQLGIPFLLLLESDVRADGLQDELKLLLRERPACNPRRRDLDPAQWDPSGRVHPTSEQLRRWREAQKECDALLDRVMRRDPDEVLERAMA